MQIEKWFGGVKSKSGVICGVSTLMALQWVAVWARDLVLLRSNQGNCDQLENEKLQWRTSQHSVVVNAVAWMWRKCCWWTAWQILLDKCCWPSILTYSCCMPCARAWQFLVSFVIPPIRTTVYWFCIVSMHLAVIDARPQEANSMSADQAHSLLACALPMPCLHGSLLFKGLRCPWVLNHAQPSYCINYSFC